MNRHHFQLILAAWLYGLLTVGARYFSERGLSLYEISLLIGGIALLLAPLMLFQKLRMRRHHVPLMALFGLVGALLQLAQFAGIVLGTPVAIVVLLLYTQPLWTILLGRTLLGEDLKRKKLAAVGLTLIGVYWLVGSNWGQTDYSLTGIVSALLGGFLLAGWVILGRVVGRRAYPASMAAFGYSLFSFLWLLLLYPLVTLATDNPQFVDLRLGAYAPLGKEIVLYVILTGAVPASLSFAGFRGVEAGVGGILLLFEPVSAALAARIAFGESLTGGMLLGGGCILLANYLAIRSRPKQISNLKSQIENPEIDALEKGSGEMRTRSLS